MNSKPLNTQFSEDSKQHILQEIISSRNAGPQKITPYPYIEKRELFEGGEKGVERLSFFLKANQAHVFNAKSPEELKQCLKVIVDQYLESRDKESINERPTNQGLDAMENITNHQELLIAKSNDVYELDVNLPVENREIYQRDDDIETKRLAIEKYAYKLDIGITTFDAGISEVGNLAMRTDKSQARSISLIPPLHIGLLKVSNIYSSVDDYFEKKPIDVKGRLSTNVVFVSGPSKTADLVGKMCYGIHGPKTLAVIFLHYL